RSSIPTACAARDCLFRPVPTSRRPSTGSCSRSAPDWIGGITWASACRAAPASAVSWIEVDEERLLVCRVGELLGVLERIEDCPGCGGRPLGPEESCPVCGRDGS